MPLFLHCGATTYTAQRILEKIALFGLNPILCGRNEALLITKKVLESSAKPGFQTPEGLFGADLLLEITGVSRTLVV
jgi:short subunit dehydrogenase-like uncharacterized protein